jgi:hypothetical protein
MCRALQKQFAEQEKATGGTPSLSMDMLTAAMAKREAARIFYQICGAPSLPRALSTKSFAVVAQLVGYRYYGCSDICHDQGQGYQDL